MKRSAKKRNQKKAFPFTIFLIASTVILLLLSLAFYFRSQSLAKEAHELLTAKQDLETQVHELEGCEENVQQLEATQRSVEQEQAQLLQSMDSLQAQVAVLQEQNEALTAAAKASTESRGGWMAEEGKPATQLPSLAPELEQVYASRVRQDVLRKELD